MAFLEIIPDLELFHLRESSNSWLHQKSVPQFSSTFEGLLAHLFSVSLDLLSVSSLDFRFEMSHTCPCRSERNPMCLLKGLSSRTPLQMYPFWNHWRTSFYRRTSLKVSRKQNAWKVICNRLYGIFRQLLSGSTCYRMQSFSSITDAFGLQKRPWFSKHYWKGFRLPVSFPTNLLTENDSPLLKTSERRLIHSKQNIFSLLLEASWTSSVWRVRKLIRSQKWRRKTRWHVVCEKCLKYTLRSFKTATRMPTRWKYCQG